MEGEITIYLKREDAELFKLFRKHQSDFQLLLDGDFFDFKKGYAMCNRDDKGVLQNVIIHKETNKRKGS